MAGRRFPLDGAFAELRREVELLRDEMRQLRQGAVTAAAELASVQAPSNTRPRTSAGGSSPAAATAKSNQELLDLSKAREAERVSRQFVENFSRVREAVRTSVTLAQRLNLPKLEKQAEKLAVALETGEAALKATVGSAKILGAAFLPGAVAVGVTVASVVALQKAVNSLTGSTLSVKETIVAFALSGEKALLGLKRTYLELSYAISGNDTGLASGLAEIDDQIRQTEGALKSLFEESAKRPPVASEGFFKDTQKSLGEFGDEVQKVLQEVLAFFDQTQAKAKETTGEVKAALTPFEQFKISLASLGDLTQGTFDFILSGVQQLSATISGALLDAFLNPQADIRQSFAQLFRALAQQLLQLMIQAVLVKALSSGFSDGGAVGEAGANPAGYAKGGRVGGRGSPSLAHLGLGAVGLAGGGLGRPSWIPASDTVPAWLTPGEFVEPVKAVKAYGMDVMEKIRTLAINPAALRALAGLGPRGGGYSLGSGAFAAGGGVSGVNPGLGGGPSVAVVVPDEATASRLYAQGPQAFMRMVRKHKSEIRSTIGR